MGIIDFGLSHLFGTNDNFLICDKFVGKMGYKSPQIFKCEAYCGNKADIWSLGITLFMMIVGAPPFHKASESDAAFAMIMNGEMMTMLARWNRVEYIESDQYDLLMKMLCIDEYERISIEDIQKHKWIQTRFRKKRISYRMSLRLCNKAKASIKMMMSSTM